MSEIAFITSAKRHRSEVAIQLRIDQQRSEAIKTLQKAEANTRRKAQLIEQRIERNLQQSRVRRNDTTVQIQIDETHAKEQQTKNTIAHDFLFKQTRAAIAEELNHIRDRREATEASLLSDLELENIKSATLDTFVQRVEDAKKALIEWTDRIKERRIIEQNANFQSTIDLKLSLDRISAAQSQLLDPHEVPRGRILDISA